MRNVKILYAIGGLMRGGKERQLMEVLKYMSDKTGYETSLLVFRKDQHYHKEAKNYVKKFYFLPNRPTRLEPFFRIGKIFRDFKPNIVHTWDTLASFYTYHSSRVFNAKFIDGSIRDSGVKKGWKYLLSKYFLTRADLAIANSYAGLNYYNVNGEVLYNIIDSNRFSQSIGQTEFNIINTSNFSRYKDHETFFKAMTKLMKDGLVDNVFLAGIGKSLQKNIDKIKSEHSELMNRFRFLGNIRDVESFLSKCKVGIVCSTSKYKEGVSNSVLEYMAAGLVAIATDVGGNREVIESGENGFLIDEYDSDGICDIIVKLRSNAKLREKIHANAFETIKTKFSYHHNMEKLTSLYCNLSDKFPGYFQKK